MPGKKRKRRKDELYIDIKPKGSTVRISPAECASKGDIDKEAQQALDEIGRITKHDRSLRMRLGAVKKHLRTIMGDHHHLN